MPMIGVAATTWSQRLLVICHFALHYYNSSYATLHLHI